MRRTGLPAERLDAFRALAEDYGADLYVAFVHAHEGETRGGRGFPEDQRNWLSGELVAFCDYDALPVWTPAHPDVRP